MREDRHQQILTLLSRHTTLSIAQISEACRVSAETVRRDLQTLEEMGYISRVHGGAMIRRELTPMMDLGERLRMHSTEKHELAERACDFVCENEVIFIDSGSTAVAFAERLAERFKNLSVITHSLDVFAVLRNTKFQLILSGGTLKREENALIGWAALETIGAYRANRAFVCPSAVSLEFGLSDLYDDLLPIQRAMLKNAESVFILADHTKLEKQAMLRIGPAKREYHYITDSNAPKAIRDMYHEKGFMLHCHEALETKR